MDCFKVGVKVEQLRKLVEKDRARAEKDYAEANKRWDEAIAKAKKALSEGGSLAGIKLYAKPSRRDIERLDRVAELLNLSLTDTVTVSLWEYNSMRYQGPESGTGIQYVVGNPAEKLAVEDLKSRIAEEVRATLETEAALQGA